MSSTSAVAVLAQGLRDLRDYAEGPDGEDLRQRTGLTTQQIDAALAGDQLPTREVTLALVAAWEGDVDAWRAYWAQIAELEAGEGKRRAGGKDAVPAAPEPSIITALPTEEAGTEPDEGGEDGLPVEDAAAAGAIAGEAEAADTSAAEPTEAEATGPATTTADVTGESRPADAETGQAAEGTASVAEAEPAAGGSTAAGAKVDAAADTPAQAAGTPAGQAAEGTAGAASATEAGLAASAREAAGAAAAPGTSTTASPSSASAGEPGATGRQAAATGSQPPTKSILMRAGIPALLFLVGVGVGAFGDHALNSESSSKPAVASVPTVSQGSASTKSPSRPTSSAGLSGGSAATSGSAISSGSSSPSGSGTIADSASSSGSSATSASSAASPGTTLGAYSNITLASSYSIDFLNDTYHPVSGTANGPDTMGFFATSFVDGQFYADRVAILDPQETGSYATCRNNTRYQKDVPLSQVSTGSSFCIHTDTGHMVLVTVRRMPSSTDANPYAVVDVTVWQDN